jgi:predicted permease
MQIFSSTIGQTIYLFVLILIGFLLTKWKLLPAETAKILAKLENMLFIPALMLKTFMSDFTVDRLSASGTLFLFSAGLLVLTVPLWLTLAINCVSPVNGLLRYALPMMAVMPLLIGGTILIVKQSKTRGSS